MNLLTRRTFLLGSGLALASYLVYDVTAIKVVRYMVPVRNLPAAFNGFTILHLSDLHQKEFGRNQTRLLDLINRQQFDMVAVTGDLVNKLWPDVEPALMMLRGLAPKPVFFVNGNNEYGALYRHRYSIAQSLGDVGVAILENRAVPLQRNGRHIWIAGVDSPPNLKDRLDRALAGVVDGAPIILLAHSPNIFQSVSAAGVDLLLVGHTHGGQIRIPWIGAIWAPQPQRGLFPQWDYGEFHEGKTTMIINGGLGESLIPIRIGLPPEIGLVTLTRMYV